MPELAVVVGRVGDIFAVQDAAMDADDEHLLVVGPVENSDPPRSGRSRVLRQRKSCSSSVALGCLKLKTWHPCGFTPDITWRIAPSFPAASIAWKIKRTAWRLDA